MMQINQLKNTQESLLMCSLAHQPLLSPRYGYYAIAEGRGWRTRLADVVQYGCLCVQSVVYCKAYERASIQTNVSMHLFTLCVRILLVFLWPEGGTGQKGREG